MGPYDEFYRAEHDYRHERMIGRRRAASMRRLVRLRAEITARRAERTARETLIRVA